MRSRPFMKSQTPILIGAILSLGLVFSFPAAGSDEERVRDLFAKYVDAAPSDEAGLPSDPSKEKERAELFDKLVALEPTTSRMLLGIIEGSSSTNLKGRAIVFLRESGIGKSNVIDVIRGFVKLEQESKSKKLLSLSISYLEKHGTREDVKLLDDLAQQGSGSLSYFSGNAKKNLEQKLSETTEPEGGNRDSFRPKESSVPDKNHVVVGEDAETPILPKWALALIAVAALGIILLLFRLFMRGRAA